jgi:outer membrane protein insertion porin family
MPAFGLLGIDFGHGFDALPGTRKANGWETFIIRPTVLSIIFAT